MSDGGVNISGQIGWIGGDIVGRDKIVVPLISMTHSVQAAELACTGLDDAWLSESCLPLELHRA